MFLAIFIVFSLVNARADVSELVTLAGMLRCDSGSEKCLFIEHENTLSEKKFSILESTSYPFAALNQYRDLYVQVMAIRQYQNVLNLGGIKPLMPPTLLTGKNEEKKK